MLSPIDEHHVGVASVVSASSFIRLGLTDAGIEMMTAANHPGLTDDFDLYRHLSASGVEALNFNHLRQFLLM